MSGEAGDICDRLRRAAGFALMCGARQTVREAATEIERLQSLTRFQERVIRSGNTASLTDAEQIAIEMAIASLTGRGCASTASTLSALLERMK